MPLSPELEALQKFIGFLQPTGLLVAPRALEHDGAVLRDDAGGLPARLEEAISPDGTIELPRLLADVLRWPLDEVLGAAGGPPLPESLELIVEERGREQIRPTFAVAGEKPTDAPSMLLQAVPAATKFDDTPERGHGWLASPHAKFERLLRHLKVPTGLLTNGAELRLVYAPHGEPSGYGTWTLADLTEPSARPLAAGLHLLLDRHRVFDEVAPRRLNDLFAKSRDYQNTVSNELSQQVLDALWELLGGFQQSGALKDVPPREAYAGLLKVLMRLVFLLYAEDQDLLPTDPLFRSNYSVRGLFARLERDAGLHPDTMDERYGAWAALLTLFRLIHDGGGHGAVRLPKREGELFNPWRHPFLEGAKAEGDHPAHERFSAPKVPDGCVFRVLNKLLVVENEKEGISERLSYRTLDVEQIGSVYESMMGFAVERASGHVVALQPKDVVVDLDALLELEGKKRVDHLKNEAEVDLAAKADEAVKKAETREELVAAFGKKLSRRTPRPLPPGSSYLQPGYERRRSGSHYTPRALTRPIVEKTLEPIFADLGPNPTPEQILELKVCDPAMGSGAFLVEACRQLAEKLVAAWEAHGKKPRIPPDETPILYARRLVAQRCLYGVDRNEFAVSLSKLSLWLVTLARDHSFTFIDHSLKHGDSLLGLDLRQIADFQWNEPGTGPLFAKYEKALVGAQSLREVIGKSSDDDVSGKAENLKEAERQVTDLRRRGDLLLAAFFSADKDKARDTKRVLFKGCADRADASAIQNVLDEIRADEHKLFVPFHWAVEFPEVFGRENSGFDAFVGNPPYSGKNGIVEGNLVGYIDWLKVMHEGAHGNADLVAHFFRRAHSLLRNRGTFGLLATKTVFQGDSRATGLRWILATRSSIYSAIRRFRWPGTAAVIVAVVHVRRGPASSATLDGVPVSRISAYLLEGDFDDDPHALAENRGLCFQGVTIHGLGFQFDDSLADRGSNRLADADALIAKEPQAASLVRPLLGWEDLTDSPEPRLSRRVLDFGDLSLEIAEREFPEATALVRERVKPVRDADKRSSYRTYWWQFAEKRKELSLARRAVDAVLVTSAKATTHLSFVRVHGTPVLTNACNIFVDPSPRLFACLQSRVHEVWARRFGSSMKDDLTYTNEACFGTYPLPAGWRASSALEDIGARYYEYRAELMKRTQKGLTKTYNRLHDQHEHYPEIVELRRLHEEMDRVVLHSYGWDDIPTACDFFPDWPVVEGSAEAEKVPYRYRWPDAVRDEVLGRLLTENQRREATCNGPEDDGAGEDSESPTVSQKITAESVGKMNRVKKTGGKQGSLL